MLTFKRRRLRLAATLLGLALCIGIGMPIAHFLRQQALDRSLILAIRHHNVPEEVDLLQQGADPNCHEDAEHPRPLREILRARLLGRPLASQPSLTALQLATKPAGNFTDLLDAADHPLNPMDLPDMARALLEHGANPNAQDPNGFTALHYAIRWQKYIVADLLLSHRANPDLGDRNHETPLMIAVYMTDTKAMRLLLNHGAHPDSRESINGQTALILALTLRKPDCAALLLERHPDLTLHDNNGKTAPDYARELGYSALLTSSKPSRAGFIKPHGKAPSHSNNAH